MATYDGRDKLGQLCRRRLGRGRNHIKCGLGWVVSAGVVAFHGLAGFG